MTLETSESLTESNGSRILRQNVEAMLRVPYLCLIPAGLILMPSLILEKSVPAWLYVTAAAFVVFPLLAAIWYRTHSDSMNAYFVLNSVGALCLITGFLLASWEMHWLSTIGWLYTDYVLLYVIGFLALCTGTALIVILRSETLRRKFGFLATRLSHGYITDEQLWYWTLPSAINVDQLKQRIHVFGGVAVLGTLAAGTLGGRAVLGYFYFVMLLPLVAVVLGSTMARFWAHWKYLRWQDLRVISKNLEMRKVGSGRF